MPATPRADRRFPIGRPPATYAGDAFINCPFDADYRPMRDAMGFAVMDCRLRPRCALEAYDGGTTRIDKIISLIRDCRWGIHDISRTEPNAQGLPRFNMPLELGLFLGAHRFGDHLQRDKSCLVLDREPYRFQQFISDIAGQDIVAHHGQPQLTIEAIRNWVAAEISREAAHVPAAAARILDEEIRRRTARLPGGAVITARFVRFCNDLPELCRRLRLDSGSLTFTNYCAVVSDWLTENEQVAGSK